VLVALVAALLTAPAALAANAPIVVNDNGDAPNGDATNATCDTDGDPSNGLQCTLRAAIQQANARPGADTITFTTGGQAPAPTTALPQVTDQLSIDGGGNTTVTFDPAAAGTLLDLHAANSLIKTITFSGGGSGILLQLSGTGDRFDAVNVQNTPGTGIRVAADSARVDGTHATGTGGDGILVNGSNDTITTPVISQAGKHGIEIGGGAVSVSTPDISGSAGNGINLTGDGATISGGSIHANSGNGVAIFGQNDMVTHVTFVANGAKPIADAPGANGGIGPPANLRIGPRRADGTLPMTGNGNGNVELWSGDPSSQSVPAFLDTFSARGDFAYNFASEPSPGSQFAVSITAGGLGTSEFETVTVPADVTSPDATFSRALGTQDVRVDFSEPIDPSSVQVQDFKLTMAGADRTINSATVAPDGLSVDLASSGWKAGEAGTIEFTAPGAVADMAGNAMTATPRLRVAAAPGDFIAPLGAKLAISPRTICLTHARNCRHTGMTIKFTTTEPGKATLWIMRSDVTVGKRLYGNIVAGANTLKWNGRLGSRKLRAGRYRLLIYVQDQVGNITDQPPITLFTVRRVT
jgi:hypothetical protein